MDAKARTQGRRPTGRADVESLGARGIGIAFHEGRPVFVPLSAAGDRMRVRLEAERGGGFRGEPLELLEEGKGRADPPCPHFGTCGGCQLQHLDAASYRAWKESLIPEALQRQGVQAGAMRPAIYIPPATRRRAALAFRRQKDQRAPGVPSAAELAVVDLSTCLLLTPEFCASGARASCCRVNDFAPAWGCRSAACGEWLDYYS